MSQIAQTQPSQIARLVGMEQAAIKLTRLATHRVEVIPPMALRIKHQILLQI
jgi:hypothetical protein